MSEHLEYTLDKFTFKVATDRLYTPEGVWAKADGSRVTVGVSDFFQQRNGDVAFAEVAEVVSGSDSAHSEKMAIRRRRTNQRKSAVFGAGVSGQVTAENGAPTDSATTKALAMKDSHASKPIGAP